MLGRLLWGAGASAVYASTMLSGVAHAAEKKRPPVEDSLSLAPVYDSEVLGDAGPLPGTTDAARTTARTELAQAEGKIAEKLEVAPVRAEGRVFRVSKLLEDYIGLARESADAALRRANATTAELSHHYRESERQAATTVAGLKADNEEMLPAAIYVLVAGLGGSIAARRRNFVVRATVPWLFGAAAFAYFLPETWANVRRLAWKYEQQQVPTLAKKHEQTAESLGQLKDQTTQIYDQSEKTVKSSMKSVRKTIKDWTGY